MHEGWLEWSLPWRRRSTAYFSPGRFSLSRQSRGKRSLLSVYACAVGINLVSTLRQTSEWYKIYQLDLPTKLCRWLSDFLVGRVIQVKIEGFLSPKVYPKAGVPQGPNLSPLLFLIHVNDMPNPSHHQTNKSQFADDTGQCAASRNIDLSAEYLQRDLDKLARWCAKWIIKLNKSRKKTKL